MDPLSMSNVSVEAQAAHVAAAVAAVAQMQQEHLQHQQNHQHQQQQQQQQLSPNNNSHSGQVAMEQDDMQDNLVNLSDMQEIEEIKEDIVSIPKEVILISLVSQEQALYNPKHEHYRNTQRKDVKWLDIAESVGWSETQCKAKWKAMRDQYCRELKRSKFNAKANVKWKYFKELDFLRPYALSRNYRPRNSLNINNNNNNNNSNNNNNNNNNSITTILPNNTTALANVVNNTSNSNNNNNNNNSNSNSNNNNNISNNNNNSSNNNNNQQEVKPFPIKIETGQFIAKDFVTTAQIKTNDSLIATLTDEQLSVMQQQQQQQQQDSGQWSYITTATTTATAALARNNSNELHINNNSGSNNSNGNGNHIHATAVTTTTASASATTTTVADDAFYNSFVAQITQHNNILVTAAGQLHQQQLQQQQQQLKHQDTNTADEEDDDPIHTFLNYESYFEKELITMIQQDDILYNSFHPNYRNVKMKLEVWDEIGRKLKKTVKQCRLKWKALRDQYIREHKRLKNRENPESLPRWKHYDALSFLQKFIKHKSGDLEKTLIEIPKTEIDDIKMDENCLSPMHHVGNDLQQQLQHALPTLSGPHSVAHNNSSTQQQVQNSLQQQLQQSLQQQQQTHQLLQQHHQQLHQHQHQQQVSDEHDESLCGGDVSGYDDMDINDYIIGDDGAADDEDGIDDDDEDIDRKSQQFPVYTPHVNAAVHSSNDDHEANDGLQQQYQHVEFKVSHDGSLTQAQTPNSHSLSQQSAAALEQHLKQHQQHIIDIDTDDNTEHLEQHHHRHQHQQQQQHEQNFTEALHASLLNGGGGGGVGNGTVPTTTSATITSPTAAAGVATAATSNNETLHTIAVGIAAAGSNSSNSHNAATTSNASTPGSQDDDEVGAFFKAVAMKIRNAKMSPVAFTDLQIDILRVINGTLRNH